MKKIGSSPLNDLLWQVEAGINECIVEEPINSFTQSQNKKNSDVFEAADFEKKNDGEIIQKVNIAGGADDIENKLVSNDLPPPPKNMGSVPERAVIEASASAKAAVSVEELKLVVSEFTGCDLKKTAINTVFADGDPSSSLMLIGLTPGADEDRRGLPFVGPAGQLLNKMLSSINIDRNACYLTNIIFWRPPGDREPTPNELAICMPFLERHIELVLPKVIVLLGGTASQSLLATTDSISKIRGEWFEYAASGLEIPIPAIPMYHPSNLLNTPIYKKEAWQDLLKIKDRLNTNMRE